MAKLEGKAALIGAEWFSLKPVKNKIEGQDSTDYVFEFWPDTNKEVFSRTFSVENWQMQHDDVWVLARAFAESSVLTEATIPVDIWRTGKHAHAYLYEPVMWLHAVLWGNKRQQGIAIRLFIQAQDDPNVFRTFFIQTSAVQATQFGMELEKEIITASPIWAKDIDTKESTLG